MSLYVFGFVLVGALFAGPVLAMVQAAPVYGEIALVLSWPGTDSVHLVEISGGRAIGPVSAPMGTLAIGTDPDFFSRLQSNGALLVRDGTLIARLCGVTL